MRRYETIFILRPNAGEDEITRVVESTSQIIENENGSIIEQNKWGMKKLAYLIKKESLGYYVYCDYASTPAAVSEIERKFRIDDTVLKYMTIKTATAITDEQIQQAIADVTEREASVAAEEQSEEKDSADEPAKEEEKVEVATPKTTEESSEAASE